MQLKLPKLRTVYLLSFLIFLLISCGETKSEKTTLFLENNTTYLPRIALALADYQHTPVRSMPQIVFDSARVNPKNIVQNGLSNWVKISFDSVPEPIVIDFLNPYEVQGFDHNYRKLARISAEKSQQLPDHERHFAFEIPLSKMPQIYYFKTYSATIDKTDVLKLIIEKKDVFDRQFYASFYQNKSTFVYYMVFIGVGLFQLIYIASLIWSRRRPEYWYYLGFTIFGVAYVYSVHRYEIGLGESPYLISSAIVSHIALITFLYSRFVRYYLDLAKFNYKLNQQLSYLEWFMLACVIINVLIYLFTGDIEYAHRFHEPVDTVVKVLNFYFVFVFYSQRSVLVNYLLMGLATMVVPAIGLFIYDWALVHQWVLKPLNFDIISIFGSILDAACLNLGLNYKHRLEVVAQQNALDNERNRIATEIHDDLGSGLSTIRLLGERAQIGIENGEKRGQIQKMTQHASELIEKMSTIIWAMNSSNDTVENLIQYIRFYAFEFLQDTHGLNLDFPLPEFTSSVFQQNLTGDTRREVFLVVKEALHNIIKHAETKSVSMIIQLKNNHLELTIIDNGKGLIKENKFGNGLKSMVKRMNKIGGNCEIINTPNKGVQIILTIPLTKVSGGFNLE
jgi:signal transduction histidine kinase